jgi:hypothetical protein
LQHQFVGNGHQLPWTVGVYWSWSGLFPAIHVFLMQPREDVDAQARA